MLKIEKVYSEDYRMTTAPKKNKIGLFWYTRSGKIHTLILI